MRLEKYFQTFWKRFLKFILSNFLVQTLQCKIREIKNLLMKIWKNPPSKVAYFSYNFSFLSCLPALPKVPILKEVNFGKMQLCRVEHLLNTFSTYLSSKLESPSPMFWLHSVESNFDDKYVEKVFNKCSTWQSYIFPKFTCFKIGTLAPNHHMTRLLSLLT